MPKSNLSKSSEIKESPQQKKLGKLALRADASFSEELELKNPLQEMKEMEISVGCVEQLDQASKPKIFNFQNTKNPKEINIINLKIEALCFSPNKLITFYNPLNAANPNYCNDYLKKLFTNLQANKDYHLTFAQAYLSFVEKCKGSTISILDFEHASKNLFSNFLLFLYIDRKPQLNSNDIRYLAKLSEKEIEALVYIGSVHTYFRIQKEELELSLNAFDCSAKMYALDVLEETFSFTRENVLLMLQTPYAYHLAYLLKEGMFLDNAGFVYRGNAFANVLNEFANNLRKEPRELLLNNYKIGLSLDIESIFAELDISEPVIINNPEPIFKKTKPNSPNQGCCFNLFKSTNKIKPNNGPAIGPSFEAKP